MIMNPNKGGNYIVRIVSICAVSLFGVYADYIVIDSDLPRCREARDVGYGRRTKKSLPSFPTGTPSKT